MTTIKFYSSDINIDIINIIKVIQHNNESVYTNCFEDESSSVHILIYEEFFFRTSSNLSVTTIIHKNLNGISIDIIASGGSVGLFGVTYGAEESALKKLQILLIDNGFKKI